MLVVTFLGKFMLNGPPCMGSVVPYMPYQPVVQCRCCVIAILGSYAVSSSYLADSVGKLVSPCTCHSGS